MNHFSGQIEQENKLKGERCPGEEMCMSIPGKPLFQYLEPGREIEEICFGSERQRPCQLRDTKPGVTPLYLVRWVDRALELRTLKEAGATYAYPDALTTREWIAIKTLTNSNAAMDIKERRRIEKQREHDAKKADLMRLTGRK
jgi:hypothetical protein